MGLLTPIVAFLAVSTCCWLVLVYAMLRRERGGRSLNFLGASLCCWLLVSYVMFASAGPVTILLGLCAVGFVAYWGWQDMKGRIGSINIGDIMTTWSWFLGTAVVLRLIMGDAPAVLP